MKKIVRLGNKDIKEIIELIFISDPSCSQIADFSKWSDGFSQGKEAWGIRSKGKLIAMGSLGYYNISGAQINIPDFWVAVLENGFVHPGYRGKGSQKILIFIRSLCALWDEKYIIHAVVRTGNIPSIKNLERMRFKNIVTQGEPGDPIYIFEFSGVFLIKLFKIINKSRAFLRRTLAFSDPMKN